METIDRSTFVGGSAAVLAAATATAADAQTEFGKPHPPIVAEDDPAITILKTSLVRPDATISAYVAMPKVMTPTTPGIVMSAHIWGIDAQYRDLARRFAKLGYIAIGPGIFDRSNPPSGDGQTDTTVFGPAVAALYAGNKMAGDLVAAHDWIKTKAPRGKIGMYGNCMGGGIVLQTLASNPVFAAACELYGYVRTDRKTSEPAPDDAYDYAPKIKAAVMGFYGGADKSINPDDVKAAFDKFGGPHDFIVYPDAPHGFLDDTRGAYRAGPAADAWAKMVAWYGKYLTT